MKTRAHDTFAIHRNIAAIIPAYNEAEHLKGVLNVLRCSPQLDEIIVVDDGSSDGTIETVKQAAVEDPRILFLQHANNLGKGQAIFTACAATQASVLLLLDADLINLKPDHVEALLQPVLSGKAEMSVGLFRGGRLRTDFSHWLTPWLSGQRCLRTDLIRYILPEAASGYGFETALTITARHRHSRTQVVFLKGVWHPPSEEHRGVLRGLIRRARMYGNILRAWWISEKAIFRRSFGSFKSRMISRID